MTRILRYTCLAAIALGATVLGCGPSQESSEVPPPAEMETTPAPAKPRPAGSAGVVDAAAEAQKRYATLCATCHGPGGKGDGAAAGALTPRPRDYTDRAWHKTVTDEMLAKAIVEGGAAVGMSNAMPPSPDLKRKPEVVAELVKIVRSFGAPEGTDTPTE